MKQNIYDNPEFFKGYMDLRSKEQGFNAAIEETCNIWPVAAT